jgi:uncharacterized protein (UPF0332 family)
MNKETRALLEKARRSLQAAEHLLGRTFSEATASRAYYAMFYSAEALLRDRGERSSSHQETQSKFGQLFAKPRIVDPKFHRYLLEGFKFRWTADYEALPRDPITQDKARMVVDWAKEFVAMAEKFLAKPGGEDG